MDSCTSVIVDGQMDGLVYECNSGRTDGCTSVLV
jgi:hypothetical protein